MSKNDDLDNDDEMFEISKRQYKKKSNKRNRATCKVKRDGDNDNLNNYTPEPLNESSQFELQPNSEDEKLNKKRQSNTTANSKRIRQKKQPQKTQQQQQEIQQEEQQPTKGDEEYYKIAQLTLPLFMQPENIRDSKGRRPDEPKYNPSTIYIPNDQYEKLSPMLKQYWNAKRNHFDSILFFRCGRWIAVIYNDAIIIAKIFNRYLGFWGKDRPCLTVYDNQLPIYQRSLLEKGYKVMIIEQMEKAELASKEDGKVIKREITQMISRGTLQDLGETDSYEQRNLLVLVYQKIPLNLKGHSYIFGISIVDCTTNEFCFDQFYDDAQYNRLRSVIYNTKPVEVILCRTSPEIEKIIKNICNPTVVLSNKSFKDCKFIFQQLKTEYMELSKEKTINKQKLFDGIIIPTYKHQFEEKMEIDINKGLFSNEKQEIREEQIVENYQLSQDYPNLLIEMEKQFYHEKKQSDKEDDESNFYSYYYSIQSFYLLLCYLRQLLISNSVYRRGKFNFLDSNFILNTHLYLDSQTLEGLEIFNVNLQTQITNSGSLFSYLNKCVTHSGKRLLTKWVQSPLQNYKSIIERQQCVKELCNFMPECYEFQKRIKSLTDLERAIVKCFNTIHSHKLKPVPSNKGENISKTKLKEIKNVLSNIRQAAEAFKIFNQNIKQFKSQKLEEIFTYKQNTHILIQSLDELEKYLIIEDNEPKPVQGINPEYDQTMNKIIKITDSFQFELEKWKKMLECPEINYIHSKIRYQLEIPEKYVEIHQKPKELIITSKIQGFLRFQTPFIEEQLSQLRLVEDELSQKLLTFINEYFTKFYTYRKEFFQLISYLSEADCLISLALVSKEQQKQVSCFPKINKDSDERDFKLIQAYHPSLLLNRNIEQVPNTISFTDSIDTLLLTGPNMSGKSTLLRLIGVSIIIAQIGCAVPAQQFSLTPFDRIFCRLGASDRLLERKSTFFIELEETKAILNYSTSKSLVIIDELGRGTSTYDGVALASAVLKFLSEKVKPITLFATHYNILLDEFELYKNIKQCVMLYYRENDSVIFKYKLVEGVAEKSFAINVAQLAGIQEEVIRKAKQMQLKITKEESKINKNREILKKFNQIITQLQ
ncbi:unnamed protein product [Paramecium primaurelia]|uniref:DNA mismatch repair protein n=1 Tax=Paramecium primaurelia TaxID=5886 RepID=A0A8S1NAQ4_PARPR|nr:unnamed protein product [Paramecium primaurelia]